MQNILHRRQENIYELKNVKVVINANIPTHESQ